MNSHSNIHKDQNRTQIVPRTGKANNKRVINLKKTINHTQPILFYSKKVNFNSIYTFPDSIVTDIIFNVLYLC